MCGLAGIIAWEDRFRVGREMLARMSARVAHRGPDAEGFYLNHGDEVTPSRPQVGLAHRRLAILDLDPRANQPFADDHGRQIVFNGEIYNFRELRAEISQVRPDHRWRTECDTEALLAAYAVWGPECLAKLNGMFAFAVWDPRDATLFLARDRMGQKPIYYSFVDHGILAFASEPAALLELPWVDRDIDTQGLADYLTWGYTPRGTIYRGMGKLAPAMWMIARGGKIQSQVYFNANEPAEIISGQTATGDDCGAGVPPAAGQRPASQTINSSAIRRARELVIEAVRKQLISDVPLGCFLSGGVDSSVIAAAMKRAVGATQPVLTFSIGFDDARYDETPYAAAVARHLGTEHREFIVRPDAAEDLPKLAATFGEPFGDSSALPTHYLSRETRRHVKVALSGDGGDELFGGYDRYRAMAMGERLPAALRRAGKMMELLPGSHPKSRVARLKRLGATLHLPAAQRYASYLRLFDRETLGQLLNADLAVATLASSEELLTRRYDELLGTGSSGGAGRDVVQAALAVDREIYLPEDLLTKVDRCSMLHALEVRSPFLDHELVQFAAGLSTQQLLRGGSKRMLREAFAADLPAEVFFRPKMGFAVPIGEWFRTSLRPMLHDALGARDSFAAGHFSSPVVERLLQEHETSRADHSQRLYALLMLELWWKSSCPPRSRS